MPKNHFPRYKGGGYGNRLTLTVRSWLYLLFRSIHKTLYPMSTVILRLKMMQVIEIRPFEKTENNKIQRCAYFNAR